MTPHHTYSCVQGNHKIYLSSRDRGRGWCRSREHEVERRSGRHHHIGIVATRRAVRRPPRASRRWPRASRGLAARRASIDRGAFHPCSVCASTSGITSGNGRPDGFRGHDRHRPVRPARTRTGIVGSGVLWCSISTYSKTSTGCTASASRTRKTRSVWVLARPFAGISRVAGCNDDQSRALAISGGSNVCRTAAASAGPARSCLTKQTIVRVGGVDGHRTGAFASRAKAPSMTPPRPTKTAPRDRSPLGSRTVLGSRVTAVISRALATRRQSRNGGTGSAAGAATSRRGFPSSGSGPPPGNSRPTFARKASVTSGCRPEPVPR
jgi:hypothetical protein